MASQPSTPQRIGAPSLPTAPSLPSLKRDPLEVLSVAEQCQRKLAKSPYIALRYLVCRFHEGLLTLRGTVPTYHTKQMAYVTVRDVPGVERVVDRIEVVYGGFRSDA